MTLEQDFFKQSKVDIDKLLKYGFIKNKEKDLYSFDISFLDNKFVANINIDTNNNVYGRVIDNEFNEEYLSFRLETIGSYALLVKEKYLEILKDIKGKCFINQPFLFNQANRLAEKIYSKYQEVPDFPFDKLSACGVFRYNQNRKWYGLIMNLKKSIITKNEKDDNIIEVLNVKASPEDINNYVGKPGIYSAYHMSHKNWITIVLDETINDEIILDFIDKSRDLIINKTTIKNNSNWLIPANPNYFDLKEAFDKNRIILWKQSSNIHVGDIVYIYVAKPVSSIKYKCKVKEVNIPYEFSNKDVSMKRVMKIELLKEYDDNSFNFELLKKYQINAIRGPRSINDELIKLLNKYLVL